MPLIPRQEVEGATTAPPSPPPRSFPSAAAPPRSPPRKQRATTTLLCSSVVVLFVCPVLSSNVVACLCWCRGNAAAGGGGIAEDAQLSGRWARPLPFTPAQYEELEQQALIYKYLVAGVPVPPDLVVPIRRGLDSLATRFYGHPTRTAPPLTLLPPLRPVLLLLC
jgi:hypothetical protein